MSLFDALSFFCNLDIMPELPEVETVKIFLRENVVKKKTLSIKIQNENLRFKVSKKIGSKLRNSIITNILRRGKYLIFLYENNFSLLFHLGMTGSFRMQRIKKTRKHDHMIFNIENNFLIFNDIRKFGFAKIYEKDQIFQSIHLKHLGPEPLGPDFDIEYFMNHSKRRTNIKNLLMNQSFVAGLGNIYCSEILHDSRIHPAREVSSLSDNELKKIIFSTKLVLEKAIELGGTTIKNFVVSDEKIGYFKNNLKVYGRENSHCLRCKGKQKVTKIVQSGRSTFFCNICQL